jgi:hypothetical protein
MEWIKCSQELPPCDGLYEVSNQPLEICQGIFEYDGIGFLHLGIYRPVSYWRDYKRLEKKYGKQ